MTYGYKIPQELDEEIALLESLIVKFRKGEITALELKAHRVPFGVYEQRERDTYMVRIRCVAGIVTPAQLAGVADIAARYGVGDLHVTSRQELQIHFVKLDDLATVIRQLKQIDLSTRGGGGNTVRNIAAQDDAGIDPDEVFDVTPYASALTSRLITESDSWNLPRKYKIAFSGSAQDKGQATLADLGFIARIVDGKKGFRVYVAGGLGAKSAVGNLLYDFVDDTNVYAIAKAVKNLFWKYGNRKNKHAARLRFLWQSLGEHEFKRRFHEELSALGPEVQPLLIDTPMLITKSSAEDSNEPRDLQDSSGFKIWKERFVKLQKQPGLYAILVPVELGFISYQTALRLAQFLGPFGDDILRMTRDQNILLRNIPSRHLVAVYSFLKEALPSAGRARILGRVLSCAGASTCQLGICLSRQAAKVLLRELASSGLDLDKAGDIRLNISGCPNACGHHPAADLGFSGKALRKDGIMYPGYSVYAGAVIHDGKTKLAELIGDVPARKLPLLVKDLLAVFISKRSRFTAFSEYIADEGKEDLRQIIARLKEIPSFKDDKNYYFDWGADKVFSLAERGTGECSAGLFDLIEVDLNNIRQIREKLHAAEGSQRGILLSDLVYFSSRALLITRGIEPKNDTELFEAFRLHFIKEGYVEPAFGELVTASEHKNTTVLLEKETKVFSFAAAIEMLYEHMDNGFNFKKVTVLPSLAPASEPVEQQKSAAFIDLRGVLCPLNFVKTKVELARLSSGERLEIWLDDGTPFENVPGSVRGEGHEVLFQERVGDYWRIIIVKK
ncbi:MAG: sulfurtransferase TusA family protein [Candidatus Omnitrophica bacterium]|nr:sulfurtransferase TusA family protein [Candidatus Omnitrophota bacterium]